MCSVLCVSALSPKMCSSFMRHLGSCWLCPFLDYPKIVWKAGLNDMQSLKHAHPSQSHHWVNECVRKMFNPNGPNMLDTKRFLNRAIKTTAIQYNQLAVLTLRSMKICSRLHPASSGHWRNCTFFTASLVKSGGYHLDLTQPESRQFSKLVSLLVVATIVPAQWKAASSQNLQPQPGAMHAFN